MGTRKKWSTTWVDANESRQNHRSEKATYTWIRAQSTNREGRVRVYVDEGHGQGWELFEVVDLSEVVPF